jgi:hypothetical protein
MTTPVFVANHIEDRLEVKPVVLTLLDSDGKVVAPVVDAVTGAILVTGSLEVEIPAPPAPEGGATEDKQDVGNASLSSIDGKITACNTGAVTISAALPAGTNAIGKLAANSGVDIGDVDVTSLPALPAGTNVIGKTGYRLVQAGTNFTRPADTTAYAIGDAVSNSTSAPTVFEIDLGALGAVAGQGLEIRKLSVVSSVKGSVLPLFNVFLSNATFTATNDNAALDIADATQEADGSWFACDIQNSTVSNARASYVNVASPMVLAAADTKLYGTIQAANAYTPASEEKFTIIAWVALL